MGTVFKGNTTITKFNEMASFPNLVLDNNQFQNCTALTEVTTPPKYTVANNFPFSGCSAMRKVHLNVTAINYACLRFPGRTRLGQCALYLPNTFTTFNNFWNYDGNQYNLIMASDTVVANNPGSGAYAVYVPDSAVQAYKMAWSSIAAKIHPMSEWEES